MNPRGPLLESNRYTKRPTTTGGSPIKVLRILTESPFRGNFLKPRSVLRGRPIRVATARAVPETLRESNIIPNNSLFRWRMRDRAAAKLSRIVLIKSSRDKLRAIIGELDRCFFCDQALL